MLKNAKLSISFGIINIMISSVFWFAIAVLIINRIELAIQFPYIDVPPLLPFDQEFASKKTIGELYTNCYNYCMISLYMLPLLLLFSFLNLIPSIKLLKDSLVKQEYKKKIKLYTILSFFLNLVFFVLLVSISIKIITDSRKEAINVKNPKQGVMIGNTIYIQSEPIIKTNDDDKYIKKIERLHDLLQKGCISQEDFEKHKSKLLDDEMNKL